MCRLNKCEARRPAVPHMGFAAGDFAALATEGAYQRMEKKMDEKLMGVVRHVLTAVGAVIVYVGYTDEATWTTTMGALMTMVPFIWSWMSKESA